MTEGNYRWSAEILNHLVFSDADNQEAKALLADSYEQLGYQYESGIWRNYYLSSANELRGGPHTYFSVGSPDVVMAMPMAPFLNLIAVRLNPDRIGDRTMTFSIDDGGEGNNTLVTLRNSVLVSEVEKSLPHPTVGLRAPRLLLMGLFVKKVPLDKMEAAGLKVAGDRFALIALLDAIEPPPPDIRGRHAVIIRNKP